jgi:integrase
VRDYDPDTSTVRIVQTKTYKTLRQPLTPEGVALFDRLTAGREPIERLFTRRDGRAWAKSDATKPMAAAVEAAKLVDVTFKTTRATYGKLLLVATRDIEMVARALGHSDSRITRKHYARYIPSELASAVAMLPALGFEQDSKVSRIGKKAKA